MLSYDFREIIIAAMDSRPTGNPSVIAALSPRPRARGLAHRLVEDIGRKIEEQTLRPGDRLPTEAEIVQSYGVSRTVVREALSKLQASGLVETHHGVGTFVLPPRATGMFRLDASELATSVDVLAVLELRISLESESAGLAAMRRTRENLQVMREALDSFERHIAVAGDGVGADLRFHLEIANATGNPYFAGIMNHLGKTLIPRTRLNSVRRFDGRAEYLGRVNREHEEIFAAVARQDAEAARATMRVHLTNSRERLKQAQLAAQAPPPVV